jgi:peptidoglycan/xylan/chitin deacetylase (PgdA/CDA1 family)
MLNLNLLVLMYHKIFEPSSPEFIHKFESHLDYLTKNFPIVLPGDKLEKNKLNICLTFDDAYCDFYSHVYPLLQTYQAKAILAVPTKYILDSTEISQDIRLSVPYPTGMDNLLFQTHAPFCTWDELKTMAHSPNVALASHSHSHLHLAKELTCQQDFDREILLSKQIIEHKTQTPVNNFVYPYGNFSRSLDKKVHEIYPHTFRIGSALNNSWERNLLYRVDATPFWLNTLSLGPETLNKYKKQYYWNRIRFK